MNILGLISQLIGIKTLRLTVLIRSLIANEQGFNFFKDYIDFLWCIFNISFKHGIRVFLRLILCTEQLLDNHKINLGILFFYTKFENILVLFVLELCLWLYSLGGGFFRWVCCWFFGMSLVDFLEISLLALCLWLYSRSVDVLRWVLRFF